MLKGVQHTHREGDTEAWVWLEDIEVGGCILLEVEQEYNRKDLEHIE